MPALTSVLFPEPTLRRSPGAVIGWWERRRPLYNAVVGVTGLVTVSLLVAVTPAILVQPGLWLGVTAYGIAANVCYTLGAPLELLLERWLGRQTYALGPTLFRYGLVYSVGLTLFPLALGAFALCARFLFHLFH